LDGFGIRGICEKNAELTIRASAQLSKPGALVLLGGTTEVVP
jgi:hypothetical protein